MTTAAEARTATVPKWTIGDRLRKARETAGFEQGELARMIGAARNTIGNYETGRTSPKPYIVAQWALITAVPAQWLLTGEAPGTDAEGLAVAGVGFEPTTSGL